ncbi:MAG TPA: methyltransferase domain-containing protein [Nocardioides sp.]|uniref:class I SAM-dependent methyltransferase n=1 Tax=Nocardioides sp. TaxID=35761 RepID=UPI002E2FE8D3|nr:methyltransferase domain-containing protein [Nocardioides sp.]HEX5089869.1 methyltransferase domain-containing protein [Nocardioides sp.]
MTEPAAGRSSSFGEGGDVTVVDRFGVWLSKRQIEKVVGPLVGKDVADVGCGYDATFMRNVLGEVGTATLTDVSLAPDLLAHPKVRAIEGFLPETMEQVADASLDVVLCMSVIEHLWEPDRTLAHFRRVLRPGGVCAVNVPSWRGKRALEYSAFKLGTSPAEEMDDHKMYYDPRDLWPLMVRAGFVPHAIRCFRHKFGLNTFAVATVTEKHL